MRDCLADARFYRLNEKKSNSRTISFHFMGYSEKSRDVKFYVPSNNFFFKMKNIKFIKNSESTKKNLLKRITFTILLLRELIVI